MELYDGNNENNMAIFIVSSFPILIYSFQGCLMTGCLNGGSCEMDEVKETFTCSCPIPWTGEKCEIKIGKRKAFTANRNELACMYT